MINPVILSTNAASATGSGGVAATLITFLPIIAIFVFFWLVFIRPQNKQRKEEEAMRKNAQIGDDITTIGGISGKIVGVKEDSDSIIIETGTDRAKLRIKRWAVGSVDTIHDVPAAAPKKKKFFGNKKADADDEAAKEKLETKD